MKYSAFLIVASMFAATSSFACSKPDAPAIPNAETTVTAEMVKAQNDVKKYIAEAEAYLSCVQNSIQHDRVVSEMQTVGDEFNATVRAFKARMQKA